jgi:hypothetical protein
MFRSIVRFSVLALAALALALRGGQPGLGQTVAPTPPGGVPLQQQLNNMRAMGQAFSSVPPYMLGFNPYAQNILNSAAPLGSLYSGLPGYGYDPYQGYGYGYYYDPYGGYLRGAASVISSQGQFAINQQQAILVREQIKAERISNRKKAMEQYLWERQNLPTLQDDRERSQAQELRRAMTQPPLTEVWSGTSLNTLLADLQKRLAQGVMTTQRSRPEPLDEDMLKHINVTPTGSAGNVGPLKNGGRLLWPLALTGPEFRAERERINNLAAELVKEAEFGNRVDAGTVRAMMDDVDRLQRALARNVGELAPSQYIEARRFLSDLDAALRTLQRPDAVSYFNRKYAARGKTVPDLVNYMKEQGLQFAPAVNGDQGAYLALYRALSGYLASTQTPPPENKP